MKDETIVPVYRAGTSHRLTPLFLGIFLLLFVPVFLTGSGPYWWPWGIGFALIVLVAGWAALSRWYTSRVSVRWLDDPGRLEFQPGRRTVDVSALTSVDRRPSEARTDLWAGTKRFSVSHRLANVEELLDRIRTRRPDLFRAPERLYFRRSTASVILQIGLFAGTAATGALLAGWHPWLGALFAAASAYVLARILFFIPRAHFVDAGSLTNLYWLRKKSWAGPAAVQESRYAAGGAVFFQLTVDFGRTNVVLDEAQLLDAIEPSAFRIEALLNLPR